MNIRKINNKLIISSGLTAILLCSCSSSSPTVTPAPTPTSATASTTSSTGPTITSFSPAAGTVTSFPTSITATFSETTMDPTTTQNVSNWTYTCTDSNGQTSTSPTTVVLSSGVATLTLPTPTLIASGAACTLQASSNIVDTSNNALSGSLSVEYTLPTVTSPYYAAVTSLTNSARISGTVPLDTVVFPTSTGTAAISSISYSLNTAILGNATLSAGEYDSSLNTTVFPDGDYTLHVNATDVNGVYYTDVTTPLSVNIENNHSAVSLPAQGGTGGSAFSVAAPAGYVLFGLRLTYSQYVYSIEPIWRTYYGTNSTLIYGTKSGADVFGSTGSSSIDLLCPGPASDGSIYAVSGLIGRSGSYNDQLGIVCSEVFDNSNPTTVGPVGGTGGSEYSSSCPPNTFITSLAGRSGNYIDQLQGSCD